MIGSKFLVSKKRSFLSAPAMFKTAEDDDNTLRNVGMGAAFSYPLAVGLINNRAKVPEARAQAKNLNELLKNIQEGDVLLTGVPKWYGVKGGIAAISNQPDFYHVNTVLENIPSRGVKSRYDKSLIDPVYKKPSKALNRHVTYGHFAGYGAPVMMARMGDDFGYENIRVLRPKKKDFANRIVRHTESIYDNPDLLYSMQQGKDSGFKEMLIPEFLRRPDDLRGLSKKQLAEKAMEDLKCVGGMCSNLPATALPELWNKPATEVLPNDLATSEHFDTVMEYRPTAAMTRKQTIKELKEEMPHLSRRALEATADRRMARWKIYDSIMGGNRGHWITRAGLGLGGAGLVAAASRIPDSDLSLGEGAIAAGLLAPSLAVSALGRVAGEDSDRRYMQGILNRRTDAVKELMSSRKITREKALKVLESNARNEINQYLAENNIKIPKKNIMVDHSLADLDSTRRFSFDDLMQSNKYDVSGNRLFVAPDRGTYLKELGRAKYLKENPGKILDYASLDHTKNFLPFLREEIGSQKNALKYVLDKEGIKGAWKYLKQTAPSFTPILNDTLRASNIAKPMMAAKLLGLGILGSQLYKDKEPDSALDRLKASLGIG
jgi:hypothetical protein